MAEIGDFNKNMTSIASNLRTKAGVAQTNKYSVTSMISTMLNLTGGLDNSGDLAGFFHRSVQSMTLPIYAQSIGPWAFANCPLSSLTSAKGITYGISAFYNSDGNTWGAEPTGYNAAVTGTYNKGTNAPARQPNGTGGVDVPAAVKTELLGRTYATFEDNFYGLASTIRAVRNTTDPLTIPDMVGEVSALNIGTNHVLAAIIDRTVTRLSLNYSNDGVSRIEPCALWGCSNLSSIILETPTDAYFFFESNSLKDCNANLSMIIRNGVFFNSSACSTATTAYPVTFVGSSRSDSTYYWELSALSYSLRGETDEWNRERTIAKGTRMAEYAINTNGGSNYGNAIKTLSFVSTTCIMSEVFQYCSNLEEVDLTGISMAIDNAFGFCKKLSSIIWRTEGMTLLGNYCFQNCSALPSTLELPTTVSVYGHDVFQSCTFTSLIVHGGNDSIGHSAFHDCSNLKVVNIDAPVKRIGAGAFESCRSLTNVTLPNTVSIIEMNAFQYDSNLSSINFPTALRYIGIYAFMSTRLTSANLYATNTSVIGYNAFEGCSRLSVVSFSPATKYINEDAFWSTSIGVVDLRHTQMVSIGSSAFRRAGNLSAVYLPSTIREVGFRAFDSIKEGAKIYYQFPASLLSQIAVSGTDSGYTGVDVTSWIHI